MTPDYPDELTSQVDPVVRPLGEYSALAVEFGGVFDAAAIGQFLGGIDPRNSSEPDTRGFINETAVFDPSLYRYGWEVDRRDRRLPFMTLGDRKWRINNLHIHCKALEPFSSVGPGAETCPEEWPSHRRKRWARRWRQVSGLWR